MSFAASLDDLTLPELLHLISFNKKSGKLTLSRRDGNALIAFRRGKIIYAASGAVRESFGSILLCRGLISESDLNVALQRQYSFREERRLGSILVDMGKVSREDVRDAMKQQAEKVITEVFQWTEGYFKFEALEIPERGEAELDVSDFLGVDGLDTDEVLLEAVSHLDEATAHQAGPMGATKSFLDESVVGGRKPRGFHVPPEWEHSGGGGEQARISMGGLMEEIQSPAFTGEIALALMRYAAQVVSRGVLFGAGTGEVRGLGQFGLESAGPMVATGVRNIRIPTTEPSLFADVICRRERYSGPPKRVFWNDYLIEKLGGQVPREVVAVPMVVGGRVEFIFYGDNLPQDRSIGPTQGLEYLMIEAGLAMEKLALETRMQRLERRRGVAARSSKGN